MSEIWNLSTLCRCCHSDGCFKKLNLPYQSENAIEIYEFMLQETLGIKIIQPTVDQASYTICDTCIKRLQEASRFREQVLACEQKFKIYFTNEQFLHSGVQLENVKSEVESNDTEYYDVNEDDDVQRDDDGVQPDDYDKTAVPLKEEIKIEVDISPLIVTKDEKTSVTESIKKEPKAVVKKGRQRAKPEGRLRRKALSSFNPRSKLLKTYVITKKNTKGITYSCKKCEGTYETRRAIYRHIHTHHRDRCKCEQCGKSFEFVTHLEKHLKVHHGNIYGCRHCGRKYDTKKRLNAHEKTHTHNQIYKCDICQKELRYKSSLRKHILSLHTDNIKSVCDVCGRSFSQRCNLEAHIQTVHLKLRPHACTICGKTYTAKKHLKNHIKIAHSDNPKPYQCLVCTKSFGCPKAYKFHKLTHENRFACRYCSEVFDNKKDLNIHIKTHTCRHLWNSPYSCHVCGKVLLSRFTLKRHVDSHSGIRRFSCDICGLKFTQKMLLKRHHLRKHDPSVKIEKVKCHLCKRLVRNMEKHMDSHDADKRKSFCDICGQNYTTNSALNRHRQQKHFGASYDCDICGKKYIKKGSLQTHKLKIHKIKKEIPDNVASVENMELTSVVT